MTGYRTNLDNISVRFGTRICVEESFDDGPGIGAVFLHSLPSGHVNSHGMVWRRRYSIAKRSRNLGGHERGLNHKMICFR